MSEVSFTLRNASPPRLYRDDFLQIPLELRAYFVDLSTQQISPDISLKSDDDFFEHPTLTPFLTSPRCYVDGINYFLQRAEVNVGDAYF